MKVLSLKGTSLAAVAGVAAITAGFPAVVEPPAWVQGKSQARPRKPKKDSYLRRMQGRVMPTEAGAVGNG